MGLSFILAYPDDTVLRMGNRSFNGEINENILDFNFEHKLILD
jgi:hypothetical protein